MYRKFGLTITLYFLSLLFANSLFSQDDELQMANDTLCIPVQLVTGYDWDKTNKKSLDEIRKLYSFGSEYFKNDDFKSAIPYFWHVFIHDTTKYSKPAIRKLATSYYKLNQFDSTLIACYRGLERYPQSSALHHYAGYIQNYMDMFNCSIPHYIFLVKYDPKNEFYLEKLAYLYYKTENELALKWQQELVNLHPENPDYHRQLAIYLEIFGYDPMEALKDAFLNDPENPIVAYDYGVIAYRAGEYQQALLPFSRLIELDSSDVKNWDYRAKCYEGLGNYSAAIKDYKQILGFEADNSVVMCQIAFNYKSLNLFAGARYWIKQALKIKPGFGLAHLIMGEIYEAAVAHCQDTEKRGRKIDDGFVYRLAMKEYEKAAKDLAYRSEANKRKAFVEPLIDTKEERFMADHDSIIEPCYTNWIK